MESPLPLTGSNARTENGEKMAREWFADVRRFVPCILTILAFSFISSILSLSFSLFFIKKKRFFYSGSIKFEDAKGNSRCEDSSLPTLLCIIFFLVENSTYTRHPCCHFALRDQMHLCTCVFYFLKFYVCVCYSFLYARNFCLLWKTNARFTF